MVQEAQFPLILEHVSKNYVISGEQILGLDDVSLDVGSGEFLAVTGPSGSGKSTLLHCAAGLDSIDTGRVVLAGTNITELSDKQLTLTRRRSAGFIFQAYNLISSKTAQENIVYPMRLRHQRPEKRWMEQVVEELGIGALLHRYPNQMSGGQQQRVAVARSMLARPQMIFADEPTGALDSEMSAQLLAMFRLCTSQLDQSIMMVTHDRDAAQLADRVIHMLDGRIQGVSLPRQGQVSSTREGMK